jgi:hypothetical protein
MGNGTCSKIAIDALAFIVGSHKWKTQTFSTGSLESPNLEKAAG